MQDLVVAKHEIVIDVAKKAFVEIEVVKGSRRSILLKFFFVENGEKFDMQNVKLAEIKGTTPGGGRVFKDLDVLEDGSIEYLISDTILGESGKTTCELQLIGPYGEVLVCHEISIKVLPNSFDENEYVAEDDISVIRAYVMRAEKAAETSEGVKEYVGKKTESYQMLEEELQQTKEEFENYTDTVKERIENGEFIGPPGIQGKAGKQGEPGKQGKQGIQGKTGESGIVTPASGYFTLSVDEDGNVYANYADEDHPPQFEMDEEMNVYLLMDDDTKVFIGNVKPQSNQVQKAVNTYLEEHPVEEGKVDLPKTANGYDYGYAGQVAVGNGAGAVEWKNPEVKYYGTLEEMLDDEQLYNYMFAVVVGENDTLDGRSATYFIYDKPVIGSVKLEKRELYACKIPVWYVSTNEQALTDGQKEQVRENIGAAAKADVEEKEKRLEEEILNLAIKPTTDPATSLHLQDSARYRVLDVSMSGKTEQATTTGKNVFDLRKVNTFDSETTGSKVEINDTGIKMKNVWAQEIMSNENVLKLFSSNTRYTCSAKVKVINKPDANLLTSISILFLYDPNNPSNSMNVLGMADKDDFANGQIIDYNFSFTTKDLSNVKLYAYCYYDSDTKKAVGEFEITEIMVRKADVTDATYEPYTGGIPSPNKDYPQEITHAGRYNEETGRYEVDVEVCNKNFYKPTIFSTQQCTARLEKDKYIFENTETTGVVVVKNELLTLKKGITYRLSLHDVVNVDRVIVWENGDVNKPLGDARATYTFTCTPTENMKIRCGIYMKDISIIGNVAECRIQIEQGTTATPYIPHESQKVTLTPPHSFTKWDSLVKRDGLYYWEFKSKKYVLNGSEKNWNMYDTYRGFHCIYNAMEKSNRKDGYCNQLTVDVQGFKPESIRNNMWIGVGNNAIYVLGIDIFDDSLEDKGLANFKAHLNENPLEIWTYSDTAEYVPVSKEEQAMLEALETYYGVTNITNSEECEMSIQYVADTKLYVDNKILEIQSAVI